MQIGVQDEAVIRGGGRSNSPVLPREGEAAALGREAPLHSGAPRFHRRSGSNGLDRASEDPRWPTQRTARGDQRASARLGDRECNEVPEKAQEPREGEGVGLVDLLTTNEAAALLNMPLNEFLTIWREGRLRYLPGRPRTFDRKDLLLYLTQMAAGEFEPTEEESTIAARRWARRAALFRRKTGPKS